MISLKILNNFSSVHRFNGSYLFKGETVPEHCEEMALLCINFSQLVPESDSKDMCYRCVIHDLEESISSDIPRPVKYRSKELKNLIDKTCYEMLSEEVDKDLLDDIKSAKDKDDINGFLVSVADRIQCYLKMFREVEIYGNRTLKEDLKSFRIYLNELLVEISCRTDISDDSKTRLLNYIYNLLNQLII